jgi:O-antigen ligase
MTHPSAQASPQRLGRRIPAAAARVRSAIPNWLSFEDVPLTLSFIGLLLYTFVTISYKFNIADIAIGAAAFGMVIQGKFRVPRPVIWFIAFALWAALASLQGYARSESIDAVYLEFKLIVVMLVAANAIRTRGQVQWFLVTYLATFGFFAMLISLYFYARGLRHAGRLVGYYTYANSNDLAALCLFAVGVSFGVAMAASRHRLVRLAAFGTGIGCIVTILLSQSRGAILAIVVAFVPLIGRVILQKKKLMIYAAFGAAVALYATPQSVWDRVAGLRNFSTSGNLRNVDKEGSAEQRWALVLTAVQITKDHPIFGVGFGAWQAASAIHAPPALRNKDTHNTYLNVAAETGLVGLGLYLALIGSILLFARRTIRKLQALARQGATAAGERAALLQWMAAGLVAFQVASIFGTNIRFSFPFLFIGVLWAACQVEQESLSGAATAGQRPARWRRSVAPRARTA